MSQYTIARTVDFLRSNLVHTWMRFRDIDSSLNEMNMGELESRAETLRVDFLLECLGKPLGMSREAINEIDDYLTWASNEELTTLHDLSKSIELLEFRTVVDMMINVWKERENNE